ncbi:MAG: carbon monoxide dehydrogenase [Rhodospirillales bacterium CG15_BIG_FIL_POST_REV_8_21_14_020_66_15]|nr:MAG: carbon monoxide dehydrogenase [Rhodospirillales bacterium CG15_BIG_FIL_POST_REV_8_21_14_020_66_15]
MDLKEERRIAAPREAVFAALNDPDILAKAIPGCESLDKVSDTEFAAVVTAKVGPVRARFNGQVTLSDLNPPESYTITGEGKGGAAGFAKGGAVIRLAEDGDGTLMTYEVRADVGGKLAQLGGRLIEGTSRKLAGEFFESFERLVVEGAGGAPAEAAPRPAPAAAGAPAGGLWIPIVVAAFAAAAYLLSTMKLVG